MNQTMGSQSYLLLALALLASLSVGCKPKDGATAGADSGGRVVL